MKSLTGKLGLAYCLGMAAVAGCGGSANGDDVPALDAGDADRSDAVDADGGMDGDSALVPDGFDDDVDDGATEDEANSDAADGEAPDSWSNANHPPVAVIAPGGPQPGKWYRPSSTESYDPDWGDSVVSYAWTIAVDGVTTQFTGLYPNVFIPCHAHDVDVTLVVRDQHGLESAPTTTSQTVVFRAEPRVSVGKCVPGDECGTEERPWCTMTAGYEHRREIGEDYPIEVEAGLYEQGTSEIGGIAVDTPESLVWESTSPSDIPVTFGAVSSINYSGHDLDKATCEGWDSTPSGVVVLTHAIGGWKTSHPRVMKLKAFCVIASPPAQEQGSIAAMSMGGTVLADGLVVRTDLIPPPVPGSSAAIAAYTVAGNGEFELSNSEIIVGSANYQAGGVLVWYGDQGYVRIGDTNISFAPGASASRTYGIYADCPNMGISGGSISGGPGVTRSVGAELSSEFVKVDDGFIFGEGGGENIGLLVEGAEEAGFDRIRVHGRQASPTPLTVSSATGVKLVHARSVALYEALSVVGAGDGVTATEAAIGIHIESASPGYPGAVGLGHSGSGVGRILGGASLRKAVGIEVSCASRLTLSDMGQVAGGQVSGPLVSEDGPSIAAGVHLARGGGTAAIYGALKLRGCEPTCVDQGVALTDAGPMDQPALLGAGLLIETDASSWPPAEAAWDVEVGEGATLSGGTVGSSAPGIEPTAELAGIWAFGDYAGGHLISLSNNVQVIGTVSGSGVDSPRISEGVRLERTKLVAEGPFSIVGGPARVTSRGVWLRNAFPIGGNAPSAGAALEAYGTATSPFAISGNSTQEASSRPISVYGIHDESHEAQDVANRVKLAGELPAAGASWSTVEGGWAAAGKGGDAVGASLTHTSHVSIDHVRIQGGTAPGGRRQRGLDLEDLRPGAGGAMPVIDGCLIEACGYVEGSTHHPECEAVVSEASVGASVHATPSALRWPLLFSNNLVFGGFNTLAGGMGTVALLATVDDVPAGALPTRHFLYNFFSGQGAAPLDPCGSEPAQESASEAVRLAFWHPPAGAAVQSTVAEFVNNVMHDGGVACRRYAVREHGLDADLTALAMRHNDYAMPMSGRDQQGANYMTALLQEARPGGGVGRCSPPEIATFPACFGAVSDASDYAGSIAVDPMFGAPGAAVLIDVPSRTPANAFLPTQPSMQAGLPTPLVLVDMAGTPRSASTPTIGPFELP